MCKTACCLAPGIAEFMEDLVPDDLIRLTAVGFRDETPTNGSFVNFDPAERALIWEDVDGFGTEVVTLDLCDIKAIALQPAP